MDNYPPGAANDPYAPYNEPQWPDVDVTVKAVLVKETVIQSPGTHYVTECEIEPDGSRSYVSFEESNEDPYELFRDQKRSPINLIVALEKIIKKLQEEHKLQWYAGYNLYDLLADCYVWDEEECEVT